MRRRFVYTLWLGLPGCLATWNPPVSEGWDHALWFTWTPADPDQHDSPGQVWRWTVPDGVQRVHLTAWGAGGGGSVGRPEDRLDIGFEGGAGGLASMEWAVTPGSTLLVVTGRGGQAGGTTGAGAWNAPAEGRSWLGHGGPGAPISGPTLPRVDGAEGGPVPGCRPLDPDGAWWCTGAGAGGGWSGVFAGEDLDDLVPDNAITIAGGGGGGGAGGPGADGGGERGDDAPDCGPTAGSVAGTGGGPATPGGQPARGITLDGATTYGPFGDALRGGSGGHANPHMGLNFRGAGTRGGGGGGGGWFGGGGGVSTLTGAPGCGGGGGSGLVRDLNGRLRSGGAPTLPAEDDDVWGRGGPAGQDGGHGGVRIQW